MKKGVLIISIDLELAWGFNYELLMGSRIAEKYLRIIKHRSRRNVRKLLELSEKFNIPFTWGVVGHLFLTSCSRGDNGLPHPDMPRPKLDIGKDWYLNDPCSDVNNEPLWYGSDIINEILESKVKHEIACHSFSHVDFSKCSKDVAIAEIRKCKEIMKDYGIISKSFIFPKNRVNYLDLLKQEGFKVFRFKVKQRYPGIRNLMSEIVHPVVRKPIEVNSLLGTPSSLLLQSPHRIDALRLLISIKRGINKAIDKKAVFHITMHDYLENDSLLNILYMVIACAIKSKLNGNLQIMTMASLDRYS